MCNDGKRIVSACLSGQVRVWDADSNECVGGLKTHGKYHQGMFIVVLVVLRSNYSPEANQVVTAPWCIAAQDDLIAVGRGDGNVEVCSKVLLAISIDLSF